MTNNMAYCCPNHPFVVWGACFLWLTSMFAIAWSLVLFFCVGDMLVLTGTDLVNAMVLLSGIIMLPTNVYILCSIANAKKIDHKTKVICCPLWLCILWIIAINCIGALLCIHKMVMCKATTVRRINSTMYHYRTIPKFKRFMDNLQWSLKCCGLNSYRDWFKNNWYDNTRDYEWNPTQRNPHSRLSSDVKTVTDSVPFSCCKSGSCVSNYLLELGTSSINTRGCGDMMHHIIICSMIMHLTMFVSIIIVEAMILNYIIPKEKCSTPVEPLEKKRSNTINDRTVAHNVRHIMSIKDNFSASSASLQLNPDDSDEFERAEQRTRYIREQSHSEYKDYKKIDEEMNSLKEGRWEDD